MNNFTKFTNIVAINEAAKRISNVVMTVSDINTYIQTVGKRIPKQVADIIYLTAKYKLVSQKDVDDIKNANFSLDNIKAYVPGEELVKNYPLTNGNIYLSSKTVNVPDASQYLEG